MVGFASLTVHSFVDLVKDFFSMPGVKVFLSKRLLQDLLERFFGTQRQRGRAHEDPSVKEFSQNTQALRVINSFCVDPVRGNCRGLKPAPVDLSKENTSPKTKTCLYKKKTGIYAHPPPLDPN